MTTVRLALYQPDIAQNTGTLMRTCACLGVRLDIIEPCGFILDDKKLKRAGMDYVDAAHVTRHIDWQGFRTAAAPARLILMTTKGAVDYRDFAFQPNDILVAGRESGGVPDDVAAACDKAVFIPMQPGTRSLNVAVACGMILGEAIRQLRTEI